MLALTGAEAPKRARETQSAALGRPSAARCWPASANPHAKRNSAERPLMANLSAHTASPLPPSRIPAGSRASSRPTSAAEAGEAASKAVRLTGGLATTCHHQLEQLDRSGRLAVPQRHLGKRDRYAVARPAGLSASNRSQLAPSAWVGVNRN